MKNKGFIIGVVAVLIIVLIGGGYLTLSSRKEPPKTVVPEPQATVEETVNILSPEDIGLTLKPISANKKLLMEIEKTDDISSLDYELSYTSMGNIPRGVIGNIEVKTKGNSVKQEIVLGTCSDVCHYDQDVSGIKLVVKVTKLDNKVYLVEKSLDQLNSIYE